MRIVEEHGFRVCQFPLTKGEKQGILIYDEEIEDLRAKGSKCLVGRLGVVKKINKEVFKTLLLRVWRAEGKVFFK